MRVNIVTEKGGWILRAISEVLREHNGWTIGEEDKYADINYFINYALAINSKYKTLKAGYFTHKDPDYLENWTKAEQICDIGVYMADRYTPKTKAKERICFYGYDVEPPSEKINVGFCGRLYDNKRKGDDEIKELVAKYGDRVNFIACGDSSWQKIGIDNIIGVDRADDFYGMIDVLYIASTLEGAPIPALDCIKRGKELIIGDVGCIEDFGTSALVGDNMEARFEFLDYLINKRKQRVNLCNRDRKWFAQKHRELFNKFV